MNQKVLNHLRQIKFFFLEFYLIKCSIVYFELGWAVLLVNIFKKVIFYFYKNLFFSFKTF